MDHWDRSNGQAQAQPAPTGDDARLLKSSVLRGRNIYHASTVIRQDVDLGRLAGMHTGQLGEGFGQRFIEGFRTLRKDLPGSDLEDSFIRRLDHPVGVPIEDVLLEAIVSIETSMAFETGRLDASIFGAIEQIGPLRNVSLIWSCFSPQISREAASIGLAGVIALLPRTLYPSLILDSKSLEAAFSSLVQKARRRRPTPTVAALAMAARQKGIPYTESRASHLRLGQGAFQRQISVPEAPADLPWQQDLGCNLEKKLAELGFPSFPKLSPSAAEIEKDGVTREPGHPSDAPASGAGATGQDYDLLVIDGRFVAASRRIPAIIEGDGERTIQQLIAALNKDPFRDNFRSMQIKSDDRLINHLNSIGRDLQDILPPGEVIALAADSTIEDGAVAIDVTNLVHADNKRMAERLVRAFDLDLGGIGFTTTDVGVSYKKGEGYVTSVKARPALHGHLWPRQGWAIDVAHAVLARSLPSGFDGKVPCILVAGDHGTGRVAREADAIFRGNGQSVGLAMRDVTFLNGEPLETNGLKRRQVMRKLLDDPRVETLISSVSLREIVARGLQVDACLVAAITDRQVDGDTEPFRQGMDVLIKSTSGKLVIGADNAVALDATRNLGRERLILVSSNLQGEAIARHLEAGAPAVVNLWSDDQDCIALFDKGETIISVPAGKGASQKLSRVDRRRLTARMFAIGLAYGAGLDPTTLEQAIKRAPDVVASTPKVDANVLKPLASHSA
jgi:cyanophycin synthetase